MPRAAQRRTSTDAAFCDIEAAELLDRTGIIAASLPQRRRSPERIPEPMPVRNPVCEPVVDQDLRPKAVVIHRRARAWLVGGAGVALLAIGWFAGSLTMPSVAEDALPVQQQPVVNQQAAPVPQAPAAQPAPQPAPVTVYVKVPAKPQVPAPKKQKRVADDEVVALPPAEPRAQEQPRTDLGSVDATTAESPDDLADEFRDLVEPAAKSMAERMAEQMMTYRGGR